MWSSSPLTSKPKWLYTKPLFNTPCLQFARPSPLPWSQYCRWAKPDLHSLVWGAESHLPCLLIPYSWVSRLRLGNSAPFSIEKHFMLPPILYSHTLFTSQCTFSHYPSPNTLTYLHSLHTAHCFSLLTPSVFPCNDNFPCWVLDPLPLLCWTQHSSSPWTAAKWLTKRW